MEISELQEQNEREHIEIKASINALEKTQLALIEKIGLLTGNNALVPVILKYVVLPLIVVLGGKIGLDYIATL